MAMTLPIGTITTPNGLFSGLWALPRPLTKHWGSGAIMERIKQVWGACDAIFGKQDQVQCRVTIDNDIKVKPTVVAEWSSLPFKDKVFSQSYWDPVYFSRIGKDKVVKFQRQDNCLREICRVTSKRLLILHPLIYPCPKGWRREAVIAITFGPNKMIRCLQSFVRKT